MTFQTKLIIKRNSNNISTTCNLNIQQSNIYQKKLIRVHEEKHAQANLYAPKVVGAKLLYFTMIFFYKRLIIGLKEPIYPQESRHYSEHACQSPTP